MLEFLSNSDVIKIQVSVYPYHVYNYSINKYEGLLKTNRIISNQYYYYHNTIHPNLSLGRSDCCVPHSHFYGSNPFYTRPFIVSCLQGDQEYYSTFLTSQCVWYTQYLIRNLLPGTGYFKVIDNPSDSCNWYIVYLFVRTSSFTGLISSTPRTRIFLE